MAFHRRHHGDSDDTELGIGAVSSKPESMTSSDAKRESNGYELKEIQVPPGQTPVGVSKAQPDPHSSLHRGLKARHISMIAIGGAIGTGLIIGT